MDSETKLYEVTRTITMRRTIPTPSQDDLSTNLKSEQQIDGWEILDRQEPVFQEMPVPKIATWEPYIWVEYDESWDGEGIHRTDGETAYVPQRLVRALGIEVAFEMTTDIHPKHILRWDETGDPLYTRTGDFWETTLPEMTLHE